MKKKKRMLQRVICLVLSGVMFMVLGGCAAEEIREENAGGMMGVANPLSSSTLEEMEKETGLTVTMDEEIFQELTVTRINMEPVMYSLDFVFKEDGNRYTFRIQGENGEKDISGMYYEWTENIESDEPVCEMHLNAEGQGICLWQNDGRNHCVSMSVNATKEALTNMCQILKELGA